MATATDDATLIALEERVKLLENSATSAPPPRPPSSTSYFCARFTLFLLTLSITAATLLTFGPTYEHSMLNHIFMEALYPISLVAWTVHEHVFSAVAVPESEHHRKLNLFTLDGVHFLLSAMCFFLCFAHCLAINNLPYVLFQGVNGIVSLLPFFFLPDLREALRTNAVVTHGAEGGDVGVVALKRGISVLSLMTFMMTEATGCIGLTSPAQRVMVSCQYAQIDAYILNHIAFLNLFDTCVVETGIVTSRAALIQCRPSIPKSIRIMAMGAALLTVFCIGMWSVRFSLVLFDFPSYENGTKKTIDFKFDKMLELVQPTAAGLVTLLPMLGWMIIQAVLFCNMRSYLNVLQELRRSSGKDAKSVEMVQVGGATLPGKEKERDQKTSTEEYVNGSSDTTGV